MIRKSLMVGRNIATEKKNICKFVNKEFTSNQDEIISFVKSLNFTARIRPAWHFQTKGLKDI